MNCLICDSSVNKYSLMLITRNFNLLDKVFNKSVGKPRNEVDLQLQIADFFTFSCYFTCMNTLVYYTFYFIKCLMILPYLQPAVKGQMVLIK